MLTKADALLADKGGAAFLRAAESPADHTAPPVPPVQCDGRAQRSSGSALRVRDRTPCASQQIGRSRQTAQEAEDRGIDLVRTLLLGPMAAAGQHGCAPQIRHEFREIRDQFVHAGERNHEIAIARDVERRNRHAQGPRRSMAFPPAHAALRAGAY